MKLRASIPAFLAVAVFCALPAMAAADTYSALSMGPDGTFSATGLTVFQKSSYILYTRATWGPAFVRITVLPNASTTITRAHGEAASVSDIGENDILNVMGKLSPGADSLTIIPTSIIDTSIQQADHTLSGIIISIDASTDSFVLSDDTFGKTAVTVLPGATITKGLRSISFSDLNVGDKILSADGAYDYTGNSLSAIALSVYQDSSIFSPHNFQGTLKSLSDTTLPATLVISVDGTDYSVFLSATSTVLDEARSSTMLSRYQPGDTVRFWGAIRQTDLTQVDAEVVRDIAF